MSEKYIKMLGDRVRMMITRGALTLAKFSVVRPQIQCTGLAGEVLQGWELFFPYGMSALPKPGGDVILLQCGGTRTHLLAIMADDASLRITDLQAGEFGWNDHNGQQIIFRHDQLEITTPLKLVGNVTGDCDLTVGGDVNLNVTGDCNVTASGDVNIDGSNVNMGGSGGKLVLLDGDGGITSSATKTFAN